MVTRIVSFKASTKFKQMELAAAAADSPVMSNWLEARREVSGPCFAIFTTPSIENHLGLENSKEPWLVALHSPLCQFCQVWKFWADGNDEKPFWVN